MPSNFEDKYINIPYYNGEPSDYEAPLGYFDDDQDLKSSAPNIANHIAQKLGYPVHDLEITDKNIYANLEDSLLKLSYLLNEYNLEESYMDKYGKEVEEEMGGKIRYDNLNRVLKLSESYATETGIGGKVPKHKGYIETQAGQQYYDLKTLYFDQEHPEEKGFTIRKVYHGRVPAVTRGGYLSSMPNTYEQFRSVVGNVGMPTEYVAMPLSWTVSQIQNVQMRRKIFGSHFSFEITGNKLMLTPVPNNSFNLFFDYTLQSEEEGDIEGSEFQEEDLISSPHQMNYKLLTWEDLSPNYRTWVINYALSQVKITLGRNRSKFQNIPYLQGQVSLDGSELISEGESQAQILIEQFREHLDNISLEREMEAKRNKAEYQLDILNKIPLGIYKS